MSRSIPRELPSEERPIPLPEPWRIRWVSPPAGDGLLWAHAYQIAKVERPTFFAFGIDLRRGAIGAAVTLSSLPTELQSSRKIRGSNPISLPDGGVELFLDVDDARAFRLTADGSGAIRDLAFLPDVTVGKRIVELRESGLARIVSRQTSGANLHQCVDIDGRVRWSVNAEALVGVSERFAVTAQSGMLVVHAIGDGSEVRRIPLTTTRTLQIWERYDLAILGADPGEEDAIADVDFLDRTTRQSLRAIDLASGEERFTAPGVASWRHPGAPVLCVTARTRRYHREEWRYDERGGVVGHREYEAPNGEEHRIVAVSGDRILLNVQAGVGRLRCETLADPIETIWERSLWTPPDARPLERVFHAHNDSVLVCEGFGATLTLLSPR